MKDSVAVQIQNLTKTIKSKNIVENLSLDIMRGEVFGFLGPNGAGKTTTIRMIVGLISKSGGQVRICGKDLEKDFRGAMNNIGAIVENPEMYKFLTGYQNLKQFANMSKGITKERIAEVVTLVGLEKRIHEKVKTYSLGMRQRLGLAQALLRKPQVLILDEPTNGLDPAGIRELRDQLRFLAKQEGITVIVSSHLLAEMELMCDRVAIIQAGKLIHVKTIKEMMSQQGTDVITEFEVDDSDLAIKFLKREYGKLPVESTDGGFETAVSREETSDIIKLLVDSGIKLYSVTRKAKTLEDSFLEMTGSGQIV